MKKLGIAILILGAGLLTLRGQEQPPDGETAPGGTPAQIEARAKRMIENAVELLANNEESRAIGMLEAVPRMFADAPSRFRAHLELGRHLTEKRQFDRASAELRRARGSEDPETQAEALLLLGRCQLARGEAGEAAMILRRVTQDYPTSLFANDAFFTLGQIHFDAGRWARAAESFNMVGTAVPADPAASNAFVLAEAGQRIYVHVVDKDLAVKAAFGESQDVELVSRSGDREKSSLVGFGRGDGDFLASVLTVTEPTKPFDGKLTVQGAEEITVKYVDENSEAGSVNLAKTAQARIVSTATLAFMDGAQRQRVRGVFADQPAFLRLRDLDMDKTPQPDTARLTIKVLYRERPEAAPDAEAPQAPAADAPWIERGTVTLALTETGPRSGIFTGRLVPRLMNLSSNAPVVELAAGEVAVQPEDKLVASFEDAAHLRSALAETREAEAVVLVGGSTEPQSIIAHASDAAVQARKLLLEAQLLQRWGNIFKEVGLDRHARDKAEEGLERVDELMALAARFSLDRKLVEESFAVKWDLQLVQDKLADAIATCHALVRLYPDTTLADRAFMQIGNARMRDKKDAESISSAIQVYNAILALPSSPLKAEAQFRIGEAIEQQIKLRPAAGGRADFAQAMVAFRRCAEAYPESSYAGDSFKRVIDYYIETRDYARCVETLERVFQDYPDAPWLDEMLLKWGVVNHRMGNREQALQKFQRLVEEYPGGQAAKQATAFLQRLSE